MLNRGADEMSVLSDDEDTRSEEIKAREFLNDTIFQMVGTQKFGVLILKKKYTEKFSKMTQII